MVRLPPAARPLFPYLKPVYTAVTRTVAPLTIAVSGRGRRGLPRGVVADLPEAAGSTGGSWVTVRPAQTITRQPPPGDDPALAVFQAAAREVVPPVYAAQLPHGRVLGRHRAVISGAGELVQAPSQYFGTTRPREHPLFLRPFPAPARHVPGRLGVLAVRGDANYYHFLIDVLPRIELLERSGFDRPSAWYCPAEFPFQRELLQTAGIDLSTVIDSARYPHVEADELVIADPPAMTEIIPPWVTRFLRRRLLPSGLSRVPGRGLYVTRGRPANNRAVVNEAEVVAALADVGFRYLDPTTLTVAEQIREFAQASVIVSAHGAALTNVAFASPGSTVVELFAAGRPVPDFWKLAESVPGVAYRYLCGPGRFPVRNRERLLVRDIQVDVPALLAVVDEAMSAAAAA